MKLDFVIIIFTFGTFISATYPAPYEIQHSATSKELLLKLLNQITKIQQEHSNEEMGTEVPDGPNTDGTKAQEEEPTMQPDSDEKMETEEPMTGKERRFFVSDGGRFLYAKDPHTN